MTTGRINQVTLLSVGETSSSSSDLRPDSPDLDSPTHTLAAEAGRVNVDKSQIVRC